MNGVLKYKGYIGTYELITDDGDPYFHGRIEYINDLVTFEAETAKGLQEEFELAVEDYLETCKEWGRDPEKPFSGKFNVRITPDLHKDLAYAAKEQGKSINDYVTSAISEKVHGKKFDIGIKKSEKYIMIHDPKEFYASSSDKSRELDKVFIAQQLEPEAIANV